MIKTLYFRVVATFLAAVIVGLISTFFITTYVFRDELRDVAEEEMIANSKEILNIYSVLKGQDAEKYLNSISMMISYEISLYDEQGQPKHYGSSRKNDPIVISDEMVRAVRNGEPYRFVGGSLDKLVVGLPVQLGKERYAMFVHLSGSKWEGLMKRMLLISLALVLLAGSVFIFVAARYLVKPLRAMTEATRRMSKGDFNIKWSWPKRKDELGELAHSFGEMAAELKQMEQMRQDFVSNVSHEIQSPLTSISGFSKILRKNNISEEQRTHYLDIIQKESERMSRLSENLLKLASLESEHHPFYPKTYALDEQIRQVIVACEPQWSAKGIHYELNLPSIKIYADQDQLYQVWMNLVSNSIKFSPEQGTISITIRLTINEIEVIISDEGIGISLEDQERIFERFYKADRSRNRTVGGSGLGLAIVIKIVRLHGGTISVSSKPGEGAEFIVRLPGIN
ncbi:HAMP domain-containing protein [Paenibacillus sp. LMG 31456]|uniref:Heme sensor protein HssS n=1 Tax=Paenibacillus foliorum TaxID=2654974 RepID=A0A972GVU9_9BACL|nr:HAMP domain-containing sensor histidine kinase [Paenibacillus foliorum]NOU97243.1 HAMP domain-containing protein [Paenibacillus foliorum]